MFAPLKPLSQPVIAELLRPRPLALMIAGAGALQLGLSGAVHLGFPCTFHAMTGMPCPGCGLTRSILALLRGDVAGSLSLHPFGMLLLAGLVASLIAGVLPPKAHQRLVGAVARVESKTGVTALMMLAFMMVWVLRITGIVHLAAV